MILLKLGQEDCQVQGWPLKPSDFKAFLGNLGKNLEQSTWSKFPPWYLEKRPKHGTPKISPAFCMETHSKLRGRTTVPSKDNMFSGWIRKIKVFLIICLSFYLFIYYLFLLIISPQGEQGSYKVKARVMTGRKLRERSPLICTGKHSWSLIKHYYRYVHGKTPQGQRMHKGYVSTSS